MDPLGIVIATRDRGEELLVALERLAALPERPPVVVVDNASGPDGAVAAVRRRFPAVTVLELPVNLGAAARNLGACLLRTPLIAFNDDDSDWAPGALTRAGEVFAAHPRLGLLAARVLVGSERRLDPTCEEMAASPLPAPAGAAGPAVLGFIACGAIVRRSAFLGVGGFERRMGIGGEEALLAVDLSAAGWELAYVDDVVTHHHPAEAGVRPGRRAREVRNALWSDWLRRPAAPALARTASVLGRSVRDADARQGVAEAVRELPWALRSRRRVPPEVAAAMAAIA
ncbi:MAG TPA: glycosyltransferase [Solirubrobacteraceae bacterium]|jgi:GT2 family glycosyltransferase